MAKYPVGKDLCVGSTVRLCDLTSTKGRQLNEQVGIVQSTLVEGRYTVSLEEGEESSIRLQPANIRKVCSACHKDNASLKICGQCEVASYCNPVCQKMHWKRGGHKQECNAMKSTTRTAQDNEDTSKDHVTWKRLSPTVRQALRNLHEKTNCTVPWPVATETPAMLSSPAPCFLTAHPNMQFKVNLEELPGGFIMQYAGEPAQDAHGVSGKRAPMGRFLPVIREDLSIYGQADEYFKHVPYHSPTQVIYGIVASQVLWTRMDHDDMNAFYKTQRSIHFDWPGVECVGVCPGTGKKVPFSMTDKHLLVVSVLAGQVKHGNDLTTLTRVMPRILTKEGYDKMMGPKGGANRLVRMTSSTVNGNVASVGKVMELFPDALRIMGNLDSPMDLNNMDSGSLPFTTASMAYDAFHSSGRYAAFERFIDDEKANIVKSSGGSINGVKLEMKGQTGIGKSHYYSK